jgi:hypothetical protein
MRTDTAAKIALAAILIILAVAAGFVTHDTTIESDHPRGPMTGDEQIHPHGQELQVEEPVPLDSKPPTPL